MKDSTIRTVLRRLEAKGYVGHELEGRTFIYRAAEARENVAARAVKHIIDRFCDGSAEQLVMGMVDSECSGRKAPGTDGPQDFSEPRRASAKSLS